jgi:tetratricopeptide (TPR) repeat protein
MVQLAEKWEERGDDAKAFKYWKMVLDKGDAYDELARYKIAKHQTKMRKSPAPLQKFIRDYADNKYRVEAMRGLVSYYRSNRDTLSEAGTYWELIQYLSTKGELTASDLNGFAWRMTQLEKYLEEALTKAKQAVDMVADEDAQTRAQIMDTEAEVLWKLGRNEEAIAIMEQCIKLQPDDDYYKQQKKKFEGS